MISGLEKSYDKIGQLKDILKELEESGKDIPAVHRNLEVINAQVNMLRIEIEPYASQNRWREECNEVESELIG